MVIYRHFGYNIDGLKCVRMRVNTDPERDTDTEDTDPKLVYIKNGGYYGR